jgi:hypothetical protein
MHSFLNIIIVFSFLAITRDSDVFSNYSVKIEALFVAFSVSTLNPAKTVDRFSTVLSASAKSLAWRNIYCSSS